MSAHSLPSGESGEENRSSTGDRLDVIRRLERDHPLMSNLDILEKLVARQHSEQQHQDSSLHSGGSSISPIVASQHRGGIRQSSEQRYAERVREILNVADFLFGSLLDAALEILEQHPAAQACANQSSWASRAHNISVIQSPTSSIRRIRATPSGRQAYLVRGSNTNITPSMPQSGTDDQTPPAKRRSIRAAATYLCLTNRQYYCSCRSFFRNLKNGSIAATGRPHSTIDLSEVLCKHLLAIKLSQLFSVMNERSPGTTATPTHLQDVEVSEVQFGRLLCEHATFS
jgi:hypothetical protein